MSPHAPSHFGVHICNSINCYCITFKRLHPWEHGLKKLFNDFIRGNEQRIRSSVQRPASSGSHLYSLKLMFTPSTHACSSIVILRRQAGRRSTHQTNRRPCEVALPNACAFAALPEGWHHAETASPFTDLLFVISSITTIHQLYCKSSGQERRSSEAVSRVII